MSEIRHCSQCAAALTPDAPKALCPACLFELAVATLPDEQTRTSLDLQAAATPTQIGVALKPLGSFGDYELLEEIARGGMGVVYKARQISLGRIVAVKMILAGQFASKQIAQRFKSEAIAAAVLHHSNIVAVHEVGVHEGQHFFSMDYVEGQNLAQLVGNRPLPAGKAARYVKIVAEAIGYAHQQGILHRDLKPSNVLIHAATDQPRVTDFGLAKRLDGESSITLTGQMLGSPSFMPPEQASGSGRKVGRHGDVYGLGGILYHLLTARAPFQAESLEAIVTQVINLDPLSPRVLNPTVPRDVETICLKCLEKEPEKRYASAQELADELGRFLHDEPIHARPVTGAERAWRWCRRKPVVAFLSAATALLVLVVAIGAPIAAFRLNAQRADLRRRLYVADMGKAYQAVKERNFGLATALLARQHQHKPGEEDLRGFEWRYLWQVCQPNPHHILLSQERFLKCAIFSPDGKILATGGYDTNVTVFDVASKKEITRFGGFDGFIDSLSLTFSRDGRLLAAKGGHVIRVWSTDNWQEVFRATNGKPNFNGNNAVVISPDNTALATRIKDGVGFWDLRTGRQLEPLTLNANPRLGDGQRLGTIMAYSRDGKVLATDELNELQLRDAHSLKVITNLVRPTPGSDASSSLAVRVTAVAFSTNLLAVGYRDGAVTLFDLQTWQKVGGGAVFQLPKLGDWKVAAPPSWKPHANFVSALAFSPDGEWLATGAADHAIFLWKVSSLRERKPDALDISPHAILKGHRGTLSSIQFSPDGQTLASSSRDGTTRLWRAAAAAEAHESIQADDVLWISCERKQLIAVQKVEKVQKAESVNEEKPVQEDKLYLWETTSNAAPRPLDIPDRAGRRAISPDGKMLALGRTNGVIELWNLETLTHTEPFPPDESPAQRILFSPDASLLITSHQVGRIKVRNLSGEKKEPVVLEGLTGQFNLSADGKMLAAHRKPGEQIELWNLVRNQSLGRLDTGTPYWDNAMAFSPDGQWLAVAGESDERLQIWKVASRQLVKYLPMPAGAMAGSIVFAPDGKTLFAFTVDNVFLLWNVATWDEIISEASYNEALVYSDGWTHGIPLFSSHGEWLALLGKVSPEGKKSIMLWHAPALQTIDALDPPNEK